MKVIFYHVPLFVSHTRPLWRRHDVNSKNCTLQRKHNLLPFSSSLLLLFVTILFSSIVLTDTQLRYIANVTSEMQRLQKESRRVSRLKIRFHRSNELTKTRCIDSGNSGWTMYGRTDRECRGRRITGQVNDCSAGSHLRGIVFFGSFLGDFRTTLGRIRARRLWFTLFLL